MYLAVTLTSTVRSITVPCKVFASPRDLITHVRSLMRSSKVRIVPVIEGGRVEGIITEREVLKVGSSRSGVLVSGLMLPSRYFLLPHDAVRKALEMMVASGILELPVIQSLSDRSLMGMASASVFLKNAPLEGKVEDYIEETEEVKAEDELVSVWERMESTGCSGVVVVRRERGKRVPIGIVTRFDLLCSRKLEDTKVRSVMKTPITISPEKSIREAVSLMEKHGIGHLPVVDRGELTGILTRLSILRVVV